MATARRAFPLAVLVLIAFSLLLTAPTTNLRAVNVSSEPEYKLWGVYWNIQPGFTSTLEMKNNRVSETVTAHVSLYFASGEEYYLRPVLLSPRQTAVIDLNRAIASLPRAVAARASREGTVEVAFDSGNASAIMASVSVKNPDRGIAWNFFLYPDGYWPEETVSPLQSAFWLPSSRADGFVAIQNVSDATATLTPRFHVNGAVHQGSPTSLLAGQGFKLELRRELRRLGLDHVDAGGIEITYQGAPGAILAHGVLFDNQGFSAEMDFLPETALEESTDFFYRTPRLALGPADPALGLPERTKFKPTLVLHNFKSYPVSLNLSLGPSAGSTPTPATIPLQLAARETRVVGLASILEGLAATGPWVNLEVSYSGTHSKLGMTLVSVSEDGKHSIRSVLNWVEAAIREGWYWQADDNTNTLLGILNSDSEAATVRMSLDYYVAGQRHSYELPDMSIAARSSALVDIGQVVASGTPDPDGDVITADITFGGYRVHKTAPRYANITTEALLLDRQSKTFLSVYNTGCCYLLPSTTPSSKTGFPGDTGPLSVKSTEGCSGAIVDFVFLSVQSGSGVKVTFQSDNPSVASIGFTSGIYTLQQPGFTVLRSTSLFPYHLGQCRRKTWPGSCLTTVKPKVTFGQLTAVGKDQTAAVQVTLTPPTAVVTLRLGTTSGSGSAWFDATNSDSFTISGSQTVTVRGITASSAVDNIHLYNDETADTELFTVISVSLLLRTAGSVSVDNGGGTTYLTVLGTTSLGTFMSTGTGNRWWRTGVEIVGVVTPSGFSSPIRIEREVILSKRYTGTTLVETLGPFPDTTLDPTLRDDDPQSGGSAGKVYDLDAPALNILSSEPIGTIYRRRVNFRQWATLNGVRVSADMFWFSRQSIIKISDVAIDRIDDVTADNIAGLGSTTQTWNLQ